MSTSQKNVSFLGTVGCRHKKFWELRIKDMNPYFEKGGENMKKLVKKIPSKKRLISFYMGECCSGSCNNS